MGRRCLLHLRSQTLQPRWANSEDMPENKIMSG